MQSCRTIVAIARLTVGRTLIAVIYKLSLYIQLHVVVDVKFFENRNCEKSSEKAMTKLEHLYSSKEGTAVNAATLQRI